jgi:ERCC4-type nuclease
MHVVSETCSYTLRNVPRIHIVFLVKMKIIIDERETVLYDRMGEFMKNNPQSSISIIKKVIPLGDVVLEHDDGTVIVILERKTFQDLLSSIRDGRYEEQSHRLIHSSGILRHNIQYIIEGMFSQITNLANRSTIFSAITSLNHFKGFSVFRTASVQETAEYVYYTAIKMQREFDKRRVPWYQTHVNASRSPELVVEGKMPSDQESNEYPNVNESRTVASESTDTSNCTTTASYTIHTNLPVISGAKEESKCDSDRFSGENRMKTEIPAYCTVVKKVKKDNVTPTNIGEIVLCQIPSISSVSAVAIMKKFGTLARLIDEVTKNPACMDDIQTVSSAGTRKISRAVLQNIRKYLIDSPSDTIVA